MQVKGNKKAEKYFSALKSVSYDKIWYENYFALVATACLFSLIRALFPLLSRRK